MREVDPIAMERSRRWCAGITRERAANFYWGLRLAPPDRRPDLYATYAWMRVADDIADGDAPGTHASPEDRLRLLDAFERATHLAIETRSRADANEASEERWPHLWPAFINAIQKHELSREWWGATLDGMREDMSHHGYAEMADLERYCYRVGSTVGLICVTIWGRAPRADQSATRVAAIARGKAFQLTNIARDIGVDARLAPPRCYVPQSVLDDAGLAPSDLIAWKRPASCAKAVQAIVARADQLRHESAALESMIDPACRPVLAAMSSIYWSVLDAIRREPERSVCVPAYRVSTARKLVCAVRACMGDGGTR